MMNRLKLPRHRHRLLILWGAMALILVSCSGSQQSSKADVVALTPSIRPAKFEPRTDQILLFAGQELEALGGTEQFTDGYWDHFDPPAGFTAYTAFTSCAPGERLKAIFEERKSAGGVQHMSLLVDDEDYQHAILAIGLSLNDQSQKVIDGCYKEQIKQLGTFILSLGRRPVFLRIGFEFDGEWNNYDSGLYKGAYRKIKDQLDAMKVQNVAYIWQSTGWGSSKAQLINYYPGNDYVDWCGFSYFAAPKGQPYKYEPMLTLARELNKPVFVAEAAPMLDVPPDNKSSAPLNLDNPQHAERAWSEWFVPFFELVEANADIIKAIHYINCNWQSQEMWQTDSPFSRSDTRLQINQTIAQRWKDRMAKDIYIKAHPGLFDSLWAK